VVDMSDMAVQCMASPGGPALKFLSGRGDGTLRLEPDDDPIRFPGTHWIINNQNTTWRFVARNLTQRRFLDADPATGNLQLLTQPVEARRGTLWEANQISPNVYTFKSLSTGAGDHRYLQGHPLEGTITLAVDGSTTDTHWRVSPAPEPIDPG
jgi:hypothetical protein